MAKVEVMYVDARGLHSEIVDAVVGKQHFAALQKRIDLPARIKGKNSKTGEVCEFYSGPAFNWNVETQLTVEVRFGLSKTYTYFADRYYNGKLAGLEGKEITVVSCRPRLVTELWDEAFEKGFDPTDYKWIESILA